MKAGSRVGSNSSAWLCHSTGASDSSNVWTAGSTTETRPPRHISQRSHCDWSCQCSGMRLAPVTTSMANSATKATAACVCDLGREITCR